MKILLINNYHYLRGGSERAYFDTAKILIERGHEVAFFSTKDSKNEQTPWSKYFVYAPAFTDPSIGIWEKIRITFRLFYNFAAKRNLEKLLKEFKPDVAHLHDIYHHLSPSIIDVLRKNKIKMVITLHDYKLISPNYNLLSNGKVWEGSKQKKYWRCFTDRCWKGSYVKSLIIALEGYLHDWLGFYEKINSFISPSRFLIDKFKEFGFKKEIVYLPNPFLPENKTISAENNSDKYILYYGRLSEEKGIDDLLRAYTKLKTETKLMIVGTGPQEAELKKIIAEEKISNVEFAGYQSGKELWQQVSGAEMIVIPSRWYENAPYTVIEAMAAGKIVVAAKIGGLTEMIDDGENGFLFASGNIGELSAKLEYVLAHPELKNAISAKAIAAIKEKNDPEKYYQSLLDVYEQARK